MIKKRIVKIIIAVAIIFAFIIIVCSCFFRTSVNIESEYEVEAVYYEDPANHQIHKDSTHFSHFSVYGEYTYVFIIRQNKVMVSYLKTNSYEHDDISIDVKNIDSQDDSMIQIDVSRNGSLEKSEAFNLREQDGIVIKLGP